MKPNPFSSLNHLTVPVAMRDAPPQCFRASCAEMLSSNVAALHLISAGLLARR